MIEAAGRILRLIVHALERLGEAVADFCVALFRYFSSHQKIRQSTEALVLLALVLAIAYSFLLAAPADFPTQTLFSVKKGATLEAVASNLKTRGVINSATLFELIARLYRSDGTVVAGEYALTEPQSILSIAHRITSGDFELEPVKVRVEEGMSVLQIQTLLSKSVPDFDAEGFYALASPQEGKLFPDTYFILPGEDPLLVVSLMTDNFKAQLRQVQVASAIAAFGKPLEEVLVMASILEREAATTQDRRIISGILWHRLDIGMKLQVDPAPDTYKTAGLPAMPIGNPSLDAILAAVTPVKTSYIFYLSDSQGKTYYSTTYEQHLQKKAKYLGK
jgi:UPF0755 protein